jgi:sugar phosphate isomerase/epimerase
MFKQGAFVNLLTPDTNEWRRQFNEIEKLPSLDHIEVWTEFIPTREHIRELRDLLRGIEVIIHGPFIHTSLASHLPEVVQLTERRFQEAVEFANVISAKVVTFHAGSYPVFFKKHEALELLAERFEPFTRLTSPLATLENMPMRSHGTMREPIGKLADCEAILKLLPKIRFTLDVGHCLQNEDDYVPFIKKHAERIENIHLHDGIPRGRAHMGLGQGTLDLDDFLNVLVSVNFNKHVGIETISSEDTCSSWSHLCKATLFKGIRSCGSVSSSEALPRRSVSRF